MPNDGKTTTDVYQRFPQNRKTLGVRWLKRHGVTAPLGLLLNVAFSAVHQNVAKCAMYFTVSSKLALPA